MRAVMTPQMGDNRHAIVDDPFSLALLEDVYELMVEGHVREGMDLLLPGLQTLKYHLTDEAWQQYIISCREHRLCELLHEDPFTFRAFTKPRGYPGDAVLLDYVYSREEGWPMPEDTSELGQKIFEETTKSSACEGVRARRGYIADLLDSFVLNHPQPDVLAIAAGHLREVLLSAAVKRRKLGRFVAMDADRESLEEVKRCYQMYGVETKRATIRQLLLHKVNLGKFDLVYSTGLFDYLSEALGRSLAESMFHLLRPGGHLVIANFQPGILDIGYMETMMAWDLIYRQRREMLELISAIPQQEIKEISIFAEENQNIIFLEVTRQ